MKRNDCIEALDHLKEKGTTEITLDITTTGKGIVYTLIW